MRAMVLEQAGQPLRLQQRERPVAGRGQVLLRVHACAICRTDLHVVDGELPEPRLPLVPGHQVVGSVVALGEGASRLTEANQALDDLRHGRLRGAGVLVIDG